MPLLNIISLNNKYRFLDSPGEMGKLIQSIDWDNSALGPMHTWPQSLRTTLSIILNSRLPKFLFWGDKHIFFYNDAFRPSLGNFGKHPASMGQTGAECWPELWGFIKPLIDKALNGESSLQEDLLLPILRNDSIENIYWSYSYSLVIDENENAAGVFVTCMDTTDKINNLKKISDSRDELEFAINAAELGTWDYDLLKDKLSINQRLKNWYGLPHDQEIDVATSIETIAIKDRGKINDAMQEALKFSSGGHYNVDYTIVNLVTKQERFVRAKGKVLFNDQQLPYRFNGIKLDITQEMVSRLALIESENNFRKLVEQAPVAICVVKGADFKAFIVNDFMLKLWDVSAGEILNKPVFKIFPETKQQFFKLFQSTFTTGKSISQNEVPVFLPRKKSAPSLVHLNYIFNAIKNINGEIEGVMLVVIDVTEHVNSRSKNKEAEEKERLVVEAVKLGTYDYNLLSGEFINSQRASTIFGIEQQLTREELLLLIHPEDKIIQTEKFAQALVSGTLFYEVRIVWEDESIHWIRVEGKVYFDNHNKPNRILGTVLDITEKREAEEELIKTNQRLAIALEVGQLGSYELDLISGELFASQSFRNNYGLDSTSTVTFDTIATLILPEYREIIKQKINESIVNNGTYSVEYPIRRPDKSFHWIKCSAKVRYDNNLKPIVLVGVTLDITELKRSQQQKDDFIGFASHELKTPVTSIKSYCQMMEEILLQKGDTQVAGMAAKIGVQVKRLNNLINDLLDITKINSGSLPIVNSIFNFTDLIKTITEDIQNTTTKINITEDFSLTGPIESDKERIVQVATNLINNAIKYSPNSNKIIVHTSLANYEMLFTVQDFGVGIAKQHHKKVFEQFYRVTGELQHTFPGLGLGLYISSEIIKQLGGKIWIRCNEEAEEGVTFCFSIPVIPPSNKISKNIVQT